MLDKNKSILEFRNFLKESLKGTYFEHSAKKIYSSFQKNKKDDFSINEEDNTPAFEILRRLLTENSNCIDIGCNTGDFLSVIYQTSPLGSHYAFEPIPRLAKRIKKRFPKINCLEIALSDRPGNATFFYVVDSPALSSLKNQFWERHISNALTEKMAVKTEKLDDILPHNLKVDLIKIDVEGLEYEVLKGSLNTLKTNKPYIIFEHGFDDSGEGHNPRIYELIDECGLQIYDLQSWLNNLSPLTKDNFISSFNWNFLAAPK